MSDIWIGIFIGTWFGATVAFVHLRVLPYLKKGKVKKKLIDYLNESGYL